MPACREKQQQTTRTAVQDRRAAEDAEEDRAEEEMLAKLASEQEALRKAEADRLKVRGCGLCGVGVAQVGGTAVLYQGLRLGSSADGSQESRGG